MTVQLYTNVTVYATSEFSASPGAAAAPLATDAGGSITLDHLHVTGAIDGNNAGNALDLVTSGNTRLTGRGSLFLVCDSDANQTDKVIQFAHDSGSELGRVDENASLSLGGSAARGTTAGTNCVHLFNGTAPAGTLANGCSIYSASGELYTMDAAGNATLQTPHDADGRWVFTSRNTVTGKALRIDMERMMRALNRYFGWNYVHDTPGQPTLPGLS